MTENATSTTASGTTRTLPQVSPETIKELFPQTVGQGRPLVLDFESKFCLSCQSLKPKLVEMVATDQDLSLYTVDINKPNERDKGIVKTFSVVTVPYVVFINGQGEIIRVIEDDVDKATLQQAGAELVAPSDT